MSKLGKKNRFKGNIGGNDGMEAIEVQENMENDQVNNLINEVINEVNFGEHDREQNGRIA